MGKNGNGRLAWADLLRCAALFAVVLLHVSGARLADVPVDSGAFMRPVISREEAEALIDAIPGIEPAVCNDSRFNHVDAFYKELFKQHSCEALVAIVKGLHGRLAERKTKSSRAESTMKRAKDILHGELSIALGIELTEVEDYIAQRIGTN